MLMAIGRPDLAALAKDGYPGAAEALAFRNIVGAAMTRLTARVGALAADPASVLVADKEVRTLLAALDKASAGDADREGFVGRALNASGKLDPLLDALRKSGAADGVAAAGVAVNQGVIARDHARTILRHVVYPELVNVDPKSAGGAVLAEIDDRLRHAASARDVNAALRIGIDHFSHKPDRFGRHGWKKFAAQLEACIMPAE